MRVLRRIAGCISGVDTDGVGQPHPSNRAVRQMLVEPSIDCIAARARLKYWASCDDVGTFNVQRPYLEQGETDEGIAGAQRLGGIGLPSFRTSHTGRDESLMRSEIQLCVSFSGTRRVLIR